MRSSKIVPRAILEWVDGLDRAPNVYAVADTLEEAERLEKLLLTALEIDRRGKPAG